MNQMRNVARLWSWSRRRWPLGLDYSWCLLSASLRWKAMGKDSESEGIKETGAEQIHLHVTSLHIFCKCSDHGKPWKPKQSSMWRNPDSKPH